MTLNGIPVANGIATAPAYVVQDTILQVPNTTVEDPTAEIQTLHHAIEQAVLSIQRIRDDIATRFDEEHANIFDAHLQIATDPELIKQTTQLIQQQHYNAAYAWKMVSDSYAELFEQMDHSYMKERVADLTDVSNRILSILLDVPQTDLRSIANDVIIVASSLTPSETAQLNTTYVKGFITKTGGKTSHTAIFANSLHIPAVVGVSTICDHVTTGDVIAIDGYNGDVYINPPDKEIQPLINKHNKMKQLQQKRERFSDKESLTKDGKTISIAANINHPTDVEQVIETGADGIGLFRTEYLYMNNLSLPSEEEQYSVYHSVLSAMPNQTVIIRTVDLGGDKVVPYLTQPKEDNPFLGRRGLRLCLVEQNLFKTQLRALLRASTSGQLHIMFPMVATVDELKEAKRLLKECEQDLRNEGYTISDSYKVGIMVEIPSVAILAEQFATEVDFFSIGTNDLIQYTFAADRMNETVSYLYQPLHPALLKLIKTVIDASHKAGIWTSLCGEMASDPVVAPVLLGLGLDGFSMTGSSILEIRQLFSTLSFKKLQSIATHALTCSTNEEVRQYVMASLHQ